MALEAGTRLGHYEVVSSLGAGGMGEVYRARDANLGREVAIKVLPEAMVRNPDRLARFEREARVLASLNHPHIVTIHAVEGEGELRFFVMELIEGRTLEAALRRGPFDADAFVETAVPIVEALAAAHQQGVTHRDLKPANVMINESGWVKVLDFGLAKEVAPSSHSASTEATTAGMTEVGKVMGTVPYMSPEQLRGLQVQATSDVFSLGVLLYEMATGRHPFRGDSDIDLASAILRDTPRAASAVGTLLPVELDPILARCLEKDPRKRFPSASDLLEALMELRDGSPAGGVELARIPTSVSAATVYRTPMVGRQSEAEQLRQALERASNGQGALVTLAGEPGVGKTRLARETISQARERGFLALVGNCYEGEGVRPFSPWVEILDATARVAPKETLRSLLGDEASEIAKIYPGLRRLYPDLPPPLELPPEAERGYLFDCFRDFIERSSELQPLLLVLEDLHWADEPTLLLLQHLAQRVAQFPLLIVATYRDVELDVARPLASSLRELVRERLVERISLGRLSFSAVSEMLAALSSREPPADLVAAIHGETEGNPFFVEEVYEHLDEEGRLFDDQGQWRDGLTLEDLEVPEGVRLVVGRRLERLPEDGRRILATAAVIGRSFSYSLVSAACEAEPDLLLEDIEAAEALHLIERTKSASPREARYQFGHELIRQTLLQGLSMPRRQQIHHQVAEAMEALYAGALDEHAAAMAHHLYQAGAMIEEDRALHFFTLAADQALAAGGFEQAVEQLDLALSLRAAERAQQIDLLWKRGRARKSLGLFAEALADWKQALTLCEQGADPATVARISWDLSLQLGWQAEPAEMVEESQRGLRLVGEAQGPERCRLLAMAGMALAFDRQFEEGDALIAEAIPMAESLGDPALLGHARLMSSYIYWHSMRMPQLVSNSEQAIEILKGTNDPRSLIDARAYLAFGKLAMGCSNVDTSEFEEAALRLGSHGDHYIFLMVRAQSAWMQSADIDRFDGLIEEAFGLPDMPWHLFARGWRGLAAFWRGDWETAYELLAEAVIGEPVGALYGVTTSSLLLVSGYLGRRSEVLALYDSEDALPRGSGPNANGAWCVLLGATEALAILGERDRAAELYSMLERAIDTGTLIPPYVPRLLQTTAGIGASCLRDWDRAEGHFREALEQAERIPFKCEQADARRWYADMLLERGAPDDTARAHRLLEEARTIYEQIGMPRHVGLTEDLLARV